MSKNISEQKSETPPRTKDHYRTVVQTRIIDDVFTDGVEMVKPKFESDYRAYVDRLWEANPDLHNCLQNADSLDKARSVRGYRFRV